MNVAIIGAGLGGLACGLHLLKSGARVTLYEQQGMPGGRASCLEEKGFRIDTGPTLLLMPEVLERLIETAGRKCSDLIRLKKIDPGYRIFFGDGRHFDMTTDHESLLRQIAYFAPALDEAFFRYLKDVQDKFFYSRRLFIERNFNSLWDLLSFDTLLGFFKIKPFGNAYEHALRFFHREDLATIFSCQTLYLGDSPFRTPALYNLLAFLEITYGVWYPEGGMFEIPKILCRLFLENGGSVRFHSKVQSILIENGRAKGIRLADGPIELADAVVSNRDVGASLMDFVPQKNRPRTPDARIQRWHYGTSCVLFYLGLKRPLGRLLHHNIFLSRDFKSSCREIFEEGRWPKEPLLYVACPTRTDPSLAPPGKEILYCLALVPNLKMNGSPPEDLSAFRERVFERLRRDGIRILPDEIELERHFLPEEFQSRFGSLYGNAFGLAPDFFQSACFRPPIRSRDVKRFYHVGASTHPGTGIPMVLISGRLAAEAVLDDLPL